MEPITSAAIISAIVSGAAEAAKNVANKGVTDAYQTLKVLLKKKFGDASDIVQTIDKLERKPSSQGHQIVLQEHCAEVKIDDDSEIRELVQILMEQLKQSVPSQHIKQHATGDGNIQIAGSGDVTINRN